MTAPTSPIPLYLQVADALRVRIDRGVWQAGSAVPTLEQIAGEFGISRVTARQAVQLLVGEGRLDAHRGRGTFVRSGPPIQRQVQLETSLVDLARMYESTTPEILTMDEGRRMPPVPGLPRSGRLGERYVYMRRLHSSEGDPYSVISIYMLDSIFALAPDDFRTQAVIPIMVRHPAVDLHQAHQTMTIGAADADTAHLLRVAAGAPVAQVQRVFKDSTDRILYFSDVVYRGDWVRWEIDLKR